MDSCIDHSFGNKQAEGVYVIIIIDWMKVIRQSWRGVRFGTHG